MDRSAGWFPTGGDDDRSMVVGDGLGGVSRKSAVPLGVHVVGGGALGARVAEWMADWILLRVVVDRPRIAPVASA